MVFWLIIVLYIALAAIPFNPLSLPTSKSVHIISLVPEGWGFFTRNPKETNVILYKKNGDKWKIWTKSNGDPSFLFGLSRKNRKIVSETISILGKLPDSSWIQNREGKINFNIPKVVSVKNDTPNQLLSGKFIIVKQDPIPWSWSKEYKHISMPYDITQVQIN